MPVSAPLSSGRLCLSYGFVKILSEAAFANFEKVKIENDIGRPASDAMWNSELPGGILRSVGGAGDPLKTGGPPPMN
jgi:hypothetical protein